jgi:hypothetical protein
MRLTDLRPVHQPAEHFPSSEQQEPKVQIAARRPSAGNHDTYGRAKHDTRHPLRAGRCEFELREHCLKLNSLGGSPTKTKKSSYTRQILLFTCKQTGPAVGHHFFYNTTLPFHD